MSPEANPIARAVPKLSRVNFAICTAGIDEGLIVGRLNQALVASGIGWISITIDVEFPLPAPWRSARRDLVLSITLAPPALQRWEYRIIPESILGLPSLEFPTLFRGAFGACLRSRPGIKFKLACHSRPNELLP